MRVSPYLPAALRTSAGRLDFELSETARNLILTVLGSVFAVLLFLGLRALVTGSGFHRFGDFYALKGLTRYRCCGAFAAASDDRCAYLRSGPPAGSISN